MIDVFFDRLNYNHPIDYRGRLDSIRYCVSLTDLLLQKLQIVQINDKDLKDAMLLLLAGEVSPTGGRRPSIAGYVAQLMADDWGFYHTATANLDKVGESAAGVAALSGSNASDIAENAAAILRQIEDDAQDRALEGAGQGRDEQALVQRGRRLVSRADAN